MKKWTFACSSTMPRPSISGRSIPLTTIGSQTQPPSPTCQRSLTLRLSSHRRISNFCVRGSMSTELYLSTPASWWPSASPRTRARVYMHYSYRWSAPRDCYRQGGSTSILRRHVSHHQTLPEKNQRTPRNLHGRQTCSGRSSTSGLVCRRLHTWSPSTR